MRYQVSFMVVVDVEADDEEAAWDKGAELVSKSVPEDIIDYDSGTVCQVEERHCETCGSDICSQCGHCHYEGYQECVSFQRRKSETENQG